MRRVLTPGEQAARDYWARLHIRSDRSKPVNIKAPRARTILGFGTRKEKSGIRREERP